MRYGIAGAGSTIATEFAKLHPEPTVTGRIHEMPLNLDRYLICTGYLAGQPLSEITTMDGMRTWHLNFLWPAQFCDRLFAANRNARVCLIGSESGFAGSYDMAYAGAKAALHLYVQTKELGWPEQMLVAVAPHIIWDSAMTQRRADREMLTTRGTKTRLGRWLNAEEVARAAFTLLDGSPAASGTILRMRTS